VPIMVEWALPRVADVGAPSRTVAEGLLWARNWGTPEPLCAVRGYGDGGFCHGRHGCRECTRVTRWLVSYGGSREDPKMTSAQGPLYAPISIPDDANHPFALVVSGWFHERHQPPSVLSG
jgi:hypothetical protein